MGSGLAKKTPEQTKTFADKEWTTMTGISLKIPLCRMAMTNTGLSSHTGIHQETNLYRTVDVAHVTRTVNKAGASIKQTS